MRIIGGIVGGRRLRAPAGPQTRPTSDRVREALFSILGPPPDGAQILDLFAGSGSLGLEAISRGAVHATFIDQSKAALQVLKHNIDTLDFGNSTEVHRADATATLKRLEKQEKRFHWIFIDPPYASGLQTECLQSLSTSQLLHENAKIIVEHDRRLPPDELYASLVKTDTRRYGDTSVSFFERNSQ